MRWHSISAVTWSVSAACFLCLVFTNDFPLRVSWGADIVIISRNNAMRQKHDPVRVLCPVHAAQTRPAAGAGGRLRQLQGAACTGCKNLQVVVVCENKTYRQAHSGNTAPAHVLRTLGPIAWANRAVAPSRAPKKKVPKEHNKDTRTSLMYLGFMRSFVAL